MWKIFYLLAGGLSPPFPVSGSFLEPPDSLALP